MPTVLVTGASSGIGKECALRLYRHGWHVFASVRSAQDGEALRAKVRDKDRLIPVYLDVTDSDAIAQAARTIEGVVGEDGLDGLVNNAGIAVAGPLEFLPLEEFRHQLDVNVIGQLAVTQAFVPLLRKARGRIVNIGSVSGRISTPLLGAYCASKFALDALTNILRMELHPWGIHVAYITPTGVATPIWRKALAEGDRISEQLPPETFTLYGPVIKSMRSMAEDNEQNGAPVQEVGKAVVRALTSPRPKARYLVGPMARIGEVLRVLPDKLREGIILNRLGK